MRALSIAATAAAILSTACSSISFVQYEQPGEQKVTTRWHNMAVNGMIEISSPLDIRTICGDRAWNKITSEFTFYNWAASAPFLKFAAFVPYTPYTNRVECFEPVKPPLKVK